MIFRFKEYTGATALEVVEQMKRDNADFTRQSNGNALDFISWSLDRLGDRLPPRELDLGNARVSAELQAHSYLSLLHDYGIGELVE